MLKRQGRTQLNTKRLFSEDFSSTLFQEANEGVFSKTCQPTILVGIEPREPTTPVRFQLKTTQHDVRIVGRIELEQKNIEKEASFGKVENSITISDILFYRRWCSLEVSSSHPGEQQNLQFIDQQPDQFRPTLSTFVSTFHKLVHIYGCTIRPSRTT